MEDGKQISILAIDDNVTQLKIFDGILGSLYKLTMIKSASEALKLLGSRGFNLILLDIEMPDVSGFEFLHEIRKIPRFMTTPVIIVTSHSDPELLSRAKKTSASDVLIKPILPESLLKSIDSALTGPAKNPFNL